MDFGMKGIAAAGLLMLATTTAEARDRWIGDWGGECGGQDIQCWVEIAPVGAGYRISWIVADRLDGARVLCRIDATAPRNDQTLKGKAADGEALVVKVIRNGAAIGGVISGLIGIITFVTYIKSFFVYFPSSGANEIHRKAVAEGKIATA